MKLQKSIIEALGKECGHSISVAKDCSSLSDDIYKKTGQRISVNTLKRLTGILKEDRKPQDYTLKVLALYLGYDSWDKLTGEYADKYGSQICEGDIQQLNIAALEKGQKVRYSYNPDRVVDLEYLGDFKFEVLDGGTSKLEKGDTLIITQLAVGHELLATTVTREWKVLGHYETAKESGIGAIILLPE